MLSASIASTVKKVNFSLPRADGLYFLSSGKEINKIEILKILLILSKKGI